MGDSENCSSCRNDPNRDNMRFDIGRGLHYYDLVGQSSRYSFIRATCLNCGVRGHYSSHCDRPQISKRCTYCTASGHAAQECRLRLSANRILFERGYVSSPIDPNDTAALTMDLPRDFHPRAPLNLLGEERTDYRGHAVSSAQIRSTPEDEDGAVGGQEIVDGTLDWPATSWDDPPTIMSPVREFDDTSTSLINTSSMISPARNEENLQPPLVPFIASGIGNNPPESTETNQSIKTETEDGDDDSDESNMERLEAVSKKKLKLH